MSLKNKLQTLLDASDNRFDQLSKRLHDRLGLNHSIYIHPYIGYGNGEQFIVRGRLLFNPETPEATDKSGYFDNLLNVYRFINSREVSGATLEIEYLDKKERTTTDTEGYFEHRFDVSSLSLPQQAVHAVNVTLIDAGRAVASAEALDNRPSPTRSAFNIAKIISPPLEKARFGVISDIDDTVLHSSATNYLKAAQLMFLHNARTRLPIEGAAALYQAWSQGGNNPIFYVSSSPWNLYPLLTDFLEFQHLPLGPLFLMDYGVSKEKLLARPHKTHKIEQVERIFTTYPELSFILVGDSGQKDTEIYLEVAKRYPGKVLAIYIRDVGDNEKRNVTLKLREENGDLGVPLLLCSHSDTIASHESAKNRIIKAEYIQKIEHYAAGENFDSSYKK